MPAQSDLSAAFARAREIVLSARRIVILTHMRADGDAIGTAAALQHVLRAADRCADALLFEPPSPKYASLAEREPLALWDDAAARELRERAELCLLVDTAARLQVTPAVGWLEQRGGRLIVLDHHVTRDIQGDVELVDESAAASALIAADFCTAAGWPLTPTAAELLFAGLATDTGWFRHANADARSFAAASRLVAAGADPTRLYDALFQRDPFERFRLFAVASGRVRLEAGGRLAVLELPLDLLRECGATPGMTEDLVNEPLRITGVVSSVLLTETEEGPIRASFRGKPGVDVGRVAERFGGGGHKLAAGAKLPGPLASARRAVVEAVTKALG